MTTTVTYPARTWVTAAAVAVRAAFTRRNAQPSELPRQALLLLALVDDHKVHEDSSFRSWVEQDNTKPRPVTACVDLLYACNPPLVDRGPWIAADSEDGPGDFRMWEVTPEGRQVLAEAWQHITGGVA